MAAVVKHLSSLIGGISQQTPELRLSNQCEDQLNCFCSPVDGLQTRPPSRFRYGGTEPLEQRAFFVIDRDKESRYNTFIGPRGIQVEDLHGNKQLIAGDTSYLKLPENSDPRTSYAVLPVADAVFVLNKTVQVSLSQKGIQAHRNRAIIHIKQVNYSTTWSVALDGVTVEFGFSADTTKTIATSLVVNGLVTALKADSTINKNFNLTPIQSLIVVERKDKGPFKIGLSDSKSGTYSSLITDAVQQFTDLPVFAPDGYVCRVKGTGVSRTDDYYVKFRASGGIRETRTWIDTGVKQSSALRTSFVVPPGQQSAFIKGHHIKAASSALENTIIGTITDVVYVPEHTEKIVRHHHGEEIISTTHFPAVYSVSVDRVFETTTIGKNFWVENVTTTDEIIGQGTWEETSAPEIPLCLDSATMPHLLVHDWASGSWSFKEADWVSRKVGDDDSNPLPSFVGRKMNGIFSFRNRLGVITDDHLIMSASGDLLNFFCETAQTLVDSAPIDISVTVDDYSPLEQVVGFNETLLLFSAERQYVLSTPDTLSPKTCAVLPASAYGLVPRHGVTTVNNKVYFMSENQEGMSVYEYHINADTGMKDASSLSSHVPGLIPKNRNSFYHLCGTADLDTLVVQCENDAHALWLYQFYSQGNQKLQSAWGRLSVPGVSIYNTAFREQELWLEGTFGNERVVLTVDLSTYQDSPIPVFTPSLDMLVRLEQKAPGTAWTLPYVPQQQNLTAVDIETGKDIPVVDLQGNVATLKRPSKAVWFGYTYPVLYVFSPQFLTVDRGSGPVPVLDGRFQLRRFKLNHSLSGPFDVIVSNVWNNAQVTYRTGIVVGQKSSILGVPFQKEGQFVVPCRGKNDEVRVTVKAQHYIPFSFTSADVEGNYIKKARSV